jgi:4-diphosphocytidyl-2-C-methyl-D-erythritol kinase
MRLRALAPAKVNLCLFLGGVREDGRHELLTLFESVSLADELTLEARDRGASDEVHCPGVHGPNLVSRALAALRDAGWEAPPVAIKIDKRIPVAAGLGGGSADAAAALRLAGALAPAPSTLVAEVAAGLGADVPGQVVPGASIGRGAGELIEPLEPLAPHAYLVLPLPFPLATAQVYRKADRLGLARAGAELAELERQLRDALARERELPTALLVNDLQPAALELRAPIEQALDDARYAGAQHAIVSGSGPTVLGLFWGEEAVGNARAGAAALAGRYAGATAAVPVDATFGAPQPN